MEQPKRKRRSKPKRDGPQPNAAPLAQATDAWASKGVAINLSLSRRRALKTFADSSGQSLTPAQALYALIDLIEPATAESQLEDSPPSRAVDDEDARLARDAALASNQIHERLNAIETDARDTKEALASCALALEEISMAMAPIRDLIATLSRSSEPSTRAVAAGVAPDVAISSLGEWVRKAIAAAGASSREKALFALRLIDRRASSGNRLVLTLQAQIREIDERPWKARPLILPPLTLSVEDGGALAVCLSVEPRADLAMLCSRAENGAWRACVRLRTGPATYGPALYDAPC